MALTLAGDPAGPAGAPGDRVVPATAAIRVVLEPGSDALAALIVDALTDGKDPAAYPNAALLERHGGIAWAQTPSSPATVSNWRTSFAACIAT